MNNLLNAYNKVVETRKAASEELENVPFQLRLGAEGRIRQAKDDLISVENQYRNLAVQHCTIIAVMGPGSVQYGKIADEKFKTVSVNYTQVLEEIADNVAKRGGRDVYGSNEHWMVMDELNKAKQRYKIVSLPVLQANFSEIGMDQPLRPALYKNLVKHYSGSLFSAVIRSAIGTLALDKGFSGKVLPVVVYNYDPEVGLDGFMLPPPVSIVEASEDIDEKSVKKSLLEARNLLNKQNTQTEGEKQ